jgi:DNA mismatch endonuclease (patch repair protein)
MSSTRCERFGKLRTISPEISARMRAVRRKDTAAELELTSALRARGMRFTSHVSVLGCTPDIIFSKAKVLVFVDGDFWHGRILVEMGVRRLERTFRQDVRAFWVPKIARNVARDAQQNRILRRNGWSVLRLWETDVLRDSKGAAAIVSKRVSHRRTKLRLP